MSSPEHIQAGRDSTEHLYPGVRVLTPSGTGEIVANQFERAEQSLRDAIAKATDGEGV